MSDDFETVRSGTCAVITILGDDRLNALRPSSWRALRDVLDDSALDPNIRSIVLIGSGSRAFSAGGDISTFNAEHAATRRATMLDAMRTFRAIEESPLPVVAAVHGIAAGAGVELALASDVVIATTEATFVLPEVRLGLVGGYAAIRLADLVGPARAKLLLLGAERIDASEAERIGLVQRFSTAERLQTDAVLLAESLSVGPALAVAATKTLINSRSQADHLRSADTVALLQGTPEATASVAEFSRRSRPHRPGENPSRST